MAIVTPTPSFTLDTAIGTSFGFAASTVALPGTPANDACVRVANIGSCTIAVKLGTSNPVPVTQSTGLAILPGQVQFLTIGANTYIGGCAAGGPGNASSVNIATGS